MNILIEILSRSVFSEPNEITTGKASGFPPRPNNQIGYEYFINHGYSLDPRIFKFLKVSVCGDISYSEAQKFCIEFERETLPLIMSRRIFARRDEKSLFEVIADTEVSFMSERFLELRDRFHSKTTHYFPLKPFAGKVFSGKNFSIITLETLIEEQAPAQEILNFFNGAEFWLVVPERSAERAFDKMEAICGSIALAMNDAERHTFGIVHSTSGHMSESGAYHSQPTRLVPSIMNVFRFNEFDHSWLTVLDKTLSDSSNNTKQLQALRFFFLSWFAVSQERFALNCMALDALIPKKMRSFRTKCVWIKAATSSDVDLVAIELLFKKIRSSIIHGDSASLSACLDYPRFIDDYRTDPLSALDNLTADVLRMGIFKGKMQERLSEVESNPELTAIVKKTFGAKAWEARIKNSNHLACLDRGYKSDWESEEPSPSGFRVILGLPARFINTLGLGRNK